MTLWQILLVSFLSGRDFFKFRSRLINIIAILFILLELFLVNTPQLFYVDNIMMSWDLLKLDNFFFYSLLIFPSLLLIFNENENLEVEHHVDFIHGFIFSLITIILILLTVILVYKGQIIYPLAIFQVSLGLALFILISSWVWLIWAGENNIEQLWIRHLLGVSNSVEHWLDDLAQPKSYKALTPQEFLQAGFEQLATLPWISGISWTSPYGEGMLGEQPRKNVTINAQSLDVTIYSHHHITGSHYFHIRLLIQLLEHFHQAKRREEAFSQQAHLKAIYETGAKLTHDIKNLLQTLHAISSAIEERPPAQFDDTQRLLQGQMPRLTQRLKRTLDKLQKPAAFSHSHIPLGLWWGNLKARYAKRHIQFEANIDDEAILIPEDLFDNATENLLQNAIMKRRREPNLHIEVFLHTNGQGLTLSISDNGSAVSPDIKQNLFEGPVTSQDGFGIGLYQVAKQMTHSGYSLQLAINEEGQVCFEVTSKD